MIQLVGPGGAGKTTVGRALSERVGIAFVDLDEQFAARAGDISAYLTVHGYQAYAAQNVQIYLDMLGALRDEAVIALSSGFMTYPDAAHPAYQDLKRDIVASPLTFVLLPSFDLETCVAETVRRQLRRPFSRSAEREEQVIRARFGAYRGLAARQFETDGSVDAVVDGLVTAAYNGQGDRRPQQVTINPIRRRVSHGQPDRRLDQTPGRAMDCSKPRSPERSCR